MLVLELCGRAGSAAVKALLVSVCWIQLSMTARATDASMAGLNNAIVLRRVLPTFV